MEWMRPYHLFAPRKTQGPITYRDFIHSLLIILFLFHVRLHVSQLPSLVPQLRPDLRSKSGMPVRSCFGGRLHIARTSSHDSLSSHTSFSLLSRHVVLGYLRRYGRFGVMHSFFSCMFAVFSFLPCSKKSTSIPLYFVSIHSVLFAATRSTSPRLNIKRTRHPPTTMDCRLLLEIGTHEHDYAFGVFCRFRLYFSDTCDHVPYFFHDTCVS